MATWLTTHIPKPKSWDEFEDITLSATKLRWQSPDFSRNGRPGQKQYGVDVYGTIEAPNIGVQCKNTTSELSEALINSELANADAFKPTLHRYYVATTAPRDEKIQQFARELSEKRRLDGKFGVELLFWEDIVNDLVKDEAALFSHYPQLKPKSPQYAFNLGDQTTMIAHNNVIEGILPPGILEAGGKSQVVWTNNHMIVLPSQYFVCPPASKRYQEMSNADLKVEIAALVAQLKQAKTLVRKYENAEHEKGKSPDWDRMNQIAVNHYEETCKVATFEALCAVISKIPDIPRRSLQPAMRHGIDAALGGGIKSGEQVAGVATFLEIYSGRLP